MIHWDPTLSGPTTNMPFLNCNRDPPPLRNQLCLPEEINGSTYAATVSIASCGHAILIFATTLSKVNSKSPEKRLTSVDVPPMSKPMTGRPLFGLYAVRAQPTKPPAGPDRTARRPVNLLISLIASTLRAKATHFEEAMSPPSLFIKSVRFPALPSVKWLLKPSTYDRRTGERYASTADELPRETALMLLDRSEERDTCWKPIVAAI